MMRRIYGDAGGFMCALAVANSLQLAEK